MDLNKFALSKFGKYVKSHDKYLVMRKNLRGAHIFKPYEEYVSTAILTSLIIAVFGLIIGVLIGIVVSRVTIIPISIALPHSAAIFLHIFYQYKVYTTIAITGGIFYLIFFGVTYSAYMLYPSFQCNIRKTKIDAMLPHALMYMYSLTRGEVNIVEIIKSVAGLPNVYGEISYEFAMVLRDMDLLGIDFMHALGNIQKETPSEQFKEFLVNLTTIVDNGGDLTEFFSIQIENYRLKKKSDHTLSLDLLSMVAECYVTGFVAGPLFIIVTGVTLGAMQGGQTFLLMAMTYAALPFGSIAFIVMIDMILPKDEQNIGLLNLKKVKEFVGIRDAREDIEKEKKLFKEFDNSKRMVHLKDILRDPLKAFYEEPILSFYITIPISMLIVSIPLISNYRVIFKGYVAFSQYITQYMILALFVGIIPYIIFFETKNRKMWKIESSIPQFLKTLSIINDTGLSLAESLRVMLRTEKGILSSYIERMYTDISWGASTVDAFTRFANKIKSTSLSRVVALVTKASETSGDIRQVLEIAAEDTNMDVQLKKDKATNMLIYTIIVYMSFFVFLYVVYTLTSAFLPQMASAGKSGGSVFIKNFDLDFNIVYFYHTALIQGFFSGLMAGVLGEGDYRSGFKHSVIMMTIAFMLFKFVVHV